MSDLETMAHVVVDYIGERYSGARVSARSDLVDNTEYVIFEVESYGGSSFAEMRKNISEAVLRVACAWRQRLPYKIHL